MFTFLDFCSRYSFSPVSWLRSGLLVLGQQAPCPGFFPPTSMAISKHLLYWLFSSTRYQSAPRLVLNSGLSSLTVLFRPRSLKMSYKLLLLLLLLSRLSCPTLCDPVNGSPPGSLVPGILQARTLEWVAISFSNAWKWKVKVKSLNRVRLLATPHPPGSSTHGIFQTRVL